MNQKTTKILEDYESKLVKEKYGESTADNDDKDSDLSEDELLELLEDDDFGGYREKRIQELHDQMKQAKTYSEQEGHGSVTTLLSERDLLDVCSNAKYSVVHFFHPDFRRCTIMDERLKEIAPKHLITRFIRINVDDAPFLVTRLGVQVLPCVISYVSGQEAGRIIGFEKLGNSDDFKVQDLEDRLYIMGVIERKSLQINQISKKNAKARKEEDDDDEDDFYD